MASGSTPYDKLAGVERLWLNRNLTINGITVAPSCWFDGTGLDPVAKTWTCRQTGTVLSLAGSGTEPTFNAEGPVNREKACKFVGNVDGGGKYLEAPNTTFCDISTEDFIILSVLKSPLAVYGSGPYEWNGKRVDGTSVGWMWGAYDWVAGGGVQWLIDIRDATGSAGTYSLGSLALDTWTLLLVVMDRSGSGQVYLQGVASGAPVSIAARQGSLSNGQAFRLGNIGAGTLDYSNAIALFAMFKAASGWLDTHLQPTLATQLHSMWCGQEAWDSSNRISTPTAL